MVAEPNPARLLTRFLAATCLFLASSCNLPGTSSNRTNEVTELPITPISGLFRVKVNEAALLSGPGPGSELSATLSQGEIVIARGVSPSGDLYEVGA